MRQNKTLLITIWLVTIAFYMYTRMISTSMSAFAIPLQHSFGFSGVDIAWAISAYSFAMLFMKIPVGMLVDRYGIDMPLLFAISIVLVGTILFAFPISDTMLFSSRFIIGIGAAFAMMSAYRLTSIIFSKHLFAFVTGFIYFFGSLAVSVSGSPLNNAISVYSYKSIVLFIAFILLTILVIYIITKSLYGKLPKSSSIRSFNDYFKGIKTIFQDRQIVYTIIYSSLFTCVFFNTIGYWGNTILVNSKMMDLSNAGLIGNSIASIASGVASIIVGIIISMQKLKRSHVAVFTTLSTISLIVILYSGVINIYTLMLMSAIFGFGFGFTGIVFDTANKRNQTYLVSILSMLFFIEYILNTIINPLVAYMHKLLATYDYSQSSCYLMAYSIFLMLLIIANIISFYIKPQK